MSKTTYKNVNAMPTWKLEEILSSPNLTGIDGADYAPVEDELYHELWKRYAKEARENEQKFHKEQKELFKHTRPKTTKSAPAQKDIQA
jgi:hypothetical protein